jgi:hypothetical protein
MRAVACIIIAVGIYMLASAGYDEYRGITTKPASFGRRHHNAAYLYRIPVLRSRNPELFHRFMTTHWIYASLVVVGGCVLYIQNLRLRSIYAEPAKTDLPCL